MLQKNCLKVTYKFSTTGGTKWNCNLFGLDIATLAQLIIDGFGGGVTSLSDQWKPEGMIKTWLELELESSLYFNSDIETALLLLTKTNY